ncbi:hypothetical protein ACLOJK_012746 [Asimina triloba]
MGKAVPRSPTAAAPAIRYVVLSDETSPTAETAVVLRLGGATRPTDAGRRGKEAWEGRPAVAGRVAGEDAARREMGKGAGDAIWVGAKDVSQRWRNSHVGLLGHSLHAYHLYTFLL